MPAESAVLAPRKVQARSRISNGSTVLDGIDGRSAVARRYRDILSGLAADMGGAASLTEARLQLCRRFAALAVQAEQMEARLAMGEAIDLNDHALLSSTLVRLASRLGIERLQRDVSPPRLNAYLRDIEEEPDDE